ncbi:MAG: hypothetical protein NVS3B9_5610 [Candidatus Doudnabacteria bacterium]
MDYKQLKISMIALALIVILALVGGVAYFKKEKANKTINPVAINQGSQKQLAPPRQIVAGFPTALVGSDLVKESYLRDYGSVKQRTTTIEEKTKNLQQIVAFYKDYLKQNNYQLLNLKQDATTSSFYGKKKGYDINILIQKDVAGYQILISYVEGL